MRFSFVILLAVTKVWGAEPATLYPGSAAITGKVKLDTPCAKRAPNAEGQIWVSRGKTLLYQAAVMPGASFEFHVTPGPIDLAVTDQSGCYFEKKLEVAAGEKKDLRDVRLTMIDPKSGRSPAMSGCYTCMMNAGLPVMSVGAMPVPMAAGPPWVPYGQFGYNNFYFPGPWSNGGLVGPMYPGVFPGMNTGGAMMGKPNVYIEAPKGTEVEVKVIPEAGSHLLAAVPIHGSVGWKAKVLGPNQIRSDGARLGFLFYDYRMDPGLLQSEAGFCAPNAKETVVQMAKVLKQSGFTDYEIKDFTVYWDVKLPAKDSYCVYPQDERSLSKVARLEVSPKSAQVTRVGFMVVPATATGRAHFKKDPVRAWVPEKTSTLRAPASKEIRVREWGVGFLAF